MGPVRVAAEVCNIYAWRALTSTRLLGINHLYYYVHNARAQRQKSYHHLPGDFGTDRNTHCICESKH